MQKIERILLVRRNRLKNFYLLVFSFLYALSFSLLSNDIFRDRDNYTAYARSFEEIFFRYDSLLAKFFNEPLFLFFNYIASFFLPSDSVPKFFVFIISFTISFFVFKSSKNFIMLLLSVLLLLLIPQLIHLQLVTLRQGLGVSLIIWAVILSKKQSFIAISIFAAGFIHSSFFIVFILFIADMCVGGNHGDKRYYLRLLLQGVIAISISLVFLYLAQMLGVRQANAEHLTGSVNISGGGLILWFSVFFVFLTRSRFYFYKDLSVRLSYIGLVSYLSMYLISPLAGRFIITFLPFILVTMVSRFNYREMSIIVLVLFLNSFFYIDTLKNNSLTSYGIKFFNL
ncbi:EpsG family protein [Paraglaciecola polaris]|uniref:EpsG family protein n=1 Tax=Paraglaciecola polaris LMG 21857 TaxID=1129793 RepID=K6YLA1_9ALTE|nr:EpsG family protein [Paraglaciecola polaris]GAC33484.1 hypothetical protein GPLA_2586 [Paraglaciecola polaris LMG 21857]